MALSQFAKNAIKHGVANNAAGVDIAARIDAGSGALAVASSEALCIGVANHAIGRGLETKFENNTALANSETWRLAAMLGSHTAALAIKTEQAT